MSARVLTMPMAAILLLLAFTGSLLVTIELYIAHLRTAEEGAAWGRVEAMATRVDDVQQLHREGTQSVFTLGMLRAAATADPPSRPLELIDDFLRETLRLSRFGITDVSVVSAEGRITWATWPALVGLDVSRRPEFQAHFQPGATGTVTGRPFIGRVGGRWLLTNSAAVRDDAGQVTQVVFLTVLAAHLGTMLDALDDAPGHRLQVLFAGDGWVRAANRGSEPLFSRGADPDNPVLRAARDAPTGRLMLDGDRPGQRMMTAYRVMLPLQRIAVASFDEALELQTFHRVARLLRMAGGVVVVLAALVVLAMQRNLRMQKRLALQASTDPLTGLLNRRALIAAAQHVLEQDPPSALGTACLMFDIDHFKQLNDNHGHAVGDEVLRRIAKALQAGSRRDDLVCRWGGEEFLLLLPDCSAADALIRSETLRLTIGALSAGDGWPGPTISCGVAHAPEHGRSLERLSMAADAALYRAKTEGRNRVEVAPSIAAASPGGLNAGSQPFTACEEKPGPSTLTTDSPSPIRTKT